MSNIERVLDEREYLLEQIADQKAEIGRIQADIVRSIVSVRDLKRRVREYENLVLREVGE